MKGIMGDYFRIYFVAFIAAVKPPGFNKKAPARLQRPTN